MKFRPKTAAVGNSNIPGPGAYEPNANATKFNQDAGKIGNSLRSNNGATKD